MKGPNHCELPKPVSFWGNTLGQGTLVGRKPGHKPLTMVMDKSSKWDMTRLTNHLLRTVRLSGRIFVWAPF